MPFLRQGVKEALPNTQKQHREAVELSRQRNMSQMKEHNKTPEKELNEMEITNLSDAEFKTLVIRMLKELTEYGKNIREEMKVSLSEIKNNLQETNSREDEAKNQINDLEHKKGKNIQLEQQEEKRFQKNKDRLRNLWDIFKHTNT